MKEDTGKEKARTQNISENKCAILSTIFDTFFFSFNRFK